MVLGGIQEDIEEGRKFSEVSLVCDYFRY